MSSWEDVRLILNRLLEREAIWNAMIDQRDELALMKELEAHVLRGAHLSRLQIQEAAGVLKRPAMIRSRSRRPSTQRL